LPNPPFDQLPAENAPTDVPTGKVQRLSDFIDTDAVWRSLYLPWFVIEREKGRTLEGGQIVEEAKFYGEVGGSK
jgi:hypothetical protein